MSIELQLVMKVMNKILQCSHQLMSKHYSFPCKKHGGIEHIGKSAYLAQCFYFMAEATNNPALKRKAASIMEHILRHHYGEERYFGLRYPYFFPGTENQLAGTNNIIVGGSVVDTLAILLNDTQNLFRNPDIARKAAEDHIKSYLATSSQTGKIISSEIPNQRLWGATGVASFAEFCKDDVQDLKDAVICSVETSLNDLNPNGGFAYHPKDRGLNEVSPYYHSRHIAFIIYSLERIGCQSIVLKYRIPLMKAIEYLKGITTKTGMKAHFTEVKTYYMGDMVELGSYAYDLYVFLRAFEIFNDRESLTFFRRGLRFVANNFDNYMVDVPLENDLYRQCSIFWLGHYAWLAKMLPFLKIASENLQSVISSLNNDAISANRSQEFVKLENKKLSAVVLLKKREFRETVGRRIGGGVPGLLVTSQGIRIFCFNGLNFRNVWGFGLRKKRKFALKLADLLFEMKLSDDARQDLKKVFLNAIELSKGEGLKSRFKALRYFSYHVTNLIERSDKNLFSATYCPKAEEKLNGRQMNVKGFLTTPLTDTIGPPYEIQYELTDSMISINTSLVVDRQFLGSYDVFCCIPTSRTKEIFIPKGKTAFIVQNAFFELYVKVSTSSVTLSRFPTCILIEFTHSGRSQEKYSVRLRIKPH
ncbi:MAG: hypothetical protein ACE5OZ_03225 [Candidatus Heimdallarchaeota archaeon]